MKTKIFFATIIAFLIMGKVNAQLSIQGFYMEYEKTISLMITYKGYEDHIIVLKDSLGNNGWKAIDTISSREKSFIILSPQMSARYKCMTNSEESNILYFTTAQTFTCTVIEKKDMRTEMSEKLLYVKVDKKKHVGNLPEETFVITMEQHIIKYALFDDKGNVIMSGDNEKALADSMEVIKNTTSFEEKITKVQKLNEFLQGLKQVEFTTVFLPNGSYMLEVYTDEGPFESQKKSTTIKIQR